MRTISRALIALLCMVTVGGELRAASALPAGDVDTRLRFVLVLTGGSEAAPDLAAYGATKVDQWYDRMFIRISDEQARELSKHPRVRFVQRMLEAGERREEPVVAEERAQAQIAPDAVDTDAVTSPTWSCGDYKYDGDGNIIGIGTDYYVYDEVGRLVRASVRGTGSYESYTYDPFGNLVARQTTAGNTVTQAVSTTSNRLTSATYDGVGNLVSGGGSPYTYGWDSFRMMSQQHGAGRNDYYVYDANDERIGSYSAPAGSWKWTIRGAGGEVVREYESSNATNAPWIWVEDFVHQGGRIIGSEREQAEGGRRHFHLDHLGTVRMVTNHAGQAISRHDYTPYGLEATSLSQEMDRGYSRANTMVFTGHERDYNSGTATANTDYLDYMHARYYKAAWARFLSADPMLGWPQASQSWNRYAYVMNNPLNAVDPRGMVPCTVSHPTVNDGKEFDSDCTTVEADAITFNGWDTTLDFLDLMAFDASRPMLNVLAGLYNDDPAQITIGYGQHALAAVPGGVGSGLTRGLGSTATSVFAASPTDDAVMVIGKLADTGVLANTPGHDVLDLANWTIEKNDAWIAQGINHGRTFYMGSNATAANLTHPVHGISVYGRELAMLMNAGYRRVGMYLVP